MDNAIKKGLVKAKPIPAQDTVSFSISAVIDPKTGGFIDQLLVAYSAPHVDTIIKCILQFWLV